MNTIDVTVTYTDGRKVKGHTVPFDSILFEREYKVPATVMGDPDKAMTEYGYWFAFQTMKRAWEQGEHEGVFEPVFDKWIQLVEEIEGPEKLEDPTPPDS